MFFLNFLMVRKGRTNYLLKQMYLWMTNEAKEALTLGIAKKLKW